MALTRPGRGKGRQTRIAYLYLLPTLVLMGGLLLFPLLRGIVASFTGYDLTEPTSGGFVGLKNYINLLSDPVFVLSLRNTLIWTTVVVSAQFVLGFATAILLNEQFPGRGVFRGLVLIPWVVPSVVAALTWRWVYAEQYGIVNHILAKLGLIATNQPWLGDPRLALPAVMVAGIWKGAPVMAVVLLAGLQSIPAQLYEAARIDGANILMTFRHITLPQMKNIIAVIVLLSTIWTFNSFDLVYVMTKGGPAHSTQLLSTYTYLTAFSFFKVGYAASMACIILIILGILAFLLMPVLMEGAQ